MKDVAAPREVESTFEGFETTKYGMVMNHRSFKVLYGGIYSNPIRACIREISSNGYDAQVHAGVPLKPFDVHLPTLHEPTFTVRDYGCSLSHEDVMGLYTRIFDSTKGDTNAEVGQFGLGSKSPFAVSDSFTATAWLNGEKRQYLNYVDDEGIPSLMYLGATPSTEPQGFEVSFPVDPNDFDEFRNEAEAVYRGFEVAPNITNGTINIPKPIFYGMNWKVYDRSVFGGHAIRQGCVVYPVTEHQLGITTCVSYQNGFVVTVPIGTVEVAANREGLQFTPDTRKRVEEAFAAASEDFKNHAVKEVVQAPNLIEAERKFIEWKQAFASNSMPEVIYSDSQGKHKLNGWVNLKDEAALLPDLRTCKGDDPFTPKFYVDVLHELKFIVDKRDRSVPRRALRIKQYRKDHFSYGDSKLIVIAESTPSQLAYLKHRLQLKDDQFLPVASLPDVVVNTGGAVGGKKSGVYKLDGSSLVKIDDDDDVPDYFYWLAIDKGTQAVVNTTLKTGHEDTGRVNAMFATAYAFLGIPQRPFLLLTLNARKRLGVTEATNMGETLRRALPTHLPRLKIMARGVGVNNDLRYSGNWSKLPRSEWNVIFTGLGVDFTDDAYESVPYLLQREMGDEWADNVKLGQATVKGLKLKQKFPMLYRDPSEADIKQYVIDQRKKP